MSPPRAAADYARLLIDGVPSLLSYWDREQRCRFASRGYQRWFGVEPEAMLGQSLADLLGPDLYAQNESHVHAVLAGDAQLMERSVRGSDGVARQSLVRYLPDIVDGQVRGFMAEVTEITQLKQVQRALEREREMRAQIEAHLQRADQLAIGRVEMLNAFAHEVRQPINNASAALQSALEALQGSEARDVVVQRVQRACSVLSRVQSAVDNTLADAVLLGGEQPLARQEVEIATLAELALAEIDSQESARVQLRCDTGARTVHVNTGLMRLALRNLMSNALHYSYPDSPVRVCISDAEDGNAIAIDVCDSGPGFPPDILPRLFLRGAKGPSPSHPGSHGLGLYIVRRVLELHGGTATLAQNSPHGARVRLLIP